MRNFLDKTKRTLFGSSWINYVVVVIIFILLYIFVTTGVFNRYLTSLTILILVMIIMSTSLNVATGFLGQLHLGHAAFMGIGAYTAAIIAIALADQIDSGLLLFLIATGSAMVTTSIAGLLIGAPALRLRGDYLGIMTLGFGEMVKTIITNMKGLTNGAQGLYGIPKIMTFPIAFWSTAIVVTLIFLFMNSRHGRAILSIREDEIASESVGINITRYKLTGFVIASMFAGVGGSILAFTIGFIAPTSFGFLKSVEIFVIVVLGGMGSLSGSIISSIVLVSLPELLRDFAEYRYLLYSTLLVLIMLFRPQGLMGTKEFNIPAFLRNTKQKMIQLKLKFSKKRSEGSDS